MQTFLDGSVLFTKDEYKANAVITSTFSAIIPLLQQIVELMDTGEENLVEFDSKTLFEEESRLLT